MTVVSSWWDLGPWGCDPHPAAVGLKETPLRRRRQKADGDIRAPGPGSSQEIRMISDIKRIYSKDVCMHACMYV